MTVILWIYLAIGEVIKMLTRDNIDILMASGAVVMLMINRLLIRPHHDGLFWVLTVSDIIVALVVVAWFSILRWRWHNNDREVAIEN